MRLASTVFLAVLAAFLLSSCIPASQFSISPLPEGTYPAWYLGDATMTSPNNFPLTTVPIWADPDEDGAFTLYSADPDVTTIVFDAESGAYAEVEKGSTTIHLRPEDK